MFRERVQCGRGEGKAEYLSGPMFGQWALVVEMVEYLSGYVLIEGTVGVEI